MAVLRKSVMVSDRKTGESMRGIVNLCTLLNE